MRRLTILLLLFFAAFVACKKHKGPPDPASVQPDNSVDSLLDMTAKINGVYWQTDTAYSYKVLSSTGDSGVISLLIIANRLVDDSIGTSINLNISNYTGIGDYAVNAPDVTATYYYDNRRFFASSGVISVRADTGNVLSGAFHFVADTVSITEGTFVVALP